MNGISMRCVEASVFFFPGRTGKLLEWTPCTKTIQFMQQKDIAIRRHCFQEEFWGNLISEQFFLQCHVWCDRAPSYTTILLHFRVWHFAPGRARGVHLVNGKHEVQSAGHGFPTHPGAKDMSAFKELWHLVVSSDLQCFNVVLSKEMGNGEIMWNTEIHPCHFEAFPATIWRCLR